MASYRSKRRRRTYKKGAGASDSFLSEDRDGHESQNAAPSKKFANETYPEFFLKYQIPRLIKLKNKNKNIDKNTLNKRNKRDEELLRITNNLEERYRKSGYFVHGEIEVNEHYEKGTPYLFDLKSFPSELLKSKSRKRKRFELNANHDQYFLFEEDEQKMKNMQEIQKMVSINSRNIKETAIIDQDDEEYDGIENKKRGQDIVEVMDDYLERQVPDENEYNFTPDDDDGVDGAINDDYIDGADGEENYF